MRVIFTSILLISLILLCGTYSYEEKNPYLPDKLPPAKLKGYELVWNDEFNTNGAPDSDKWDFEYGFVRNRELQWYQPQNATCKDGRLIITGKKDYIENPNYHPNGSSWKSNRTHAEYSSSCLLTKDKAEWSSDLYIEVRAKIDTSSASWPAIWMLGSENKWPHCGEIDIMEFYRPNGIPSVLANVAWGSSKKHIATWDSSIHPLREFLKNDPEWPNKYHIWSLKWDENKISIFLDDILLNETLLNHTLNPDGQNPFVKNSKHYLLLNLALGSNGGKPSNDEFPLTFEVDYVRVYKKKP